MRIETAMRWTEVHKPGWPRWRSILLWPLIPLERRCRHCLGTWPCAGITWARRVLAGTGKTR